MSASLLLPETGVPWIKILFGFSPREALNSPTTDPMFLAKPSLYFHTEILGNDLESMVISAVKMSKFSCRKAFSIGSCSTFPLPMVCEMRLISWL